MLRLYERKIVGRGVVLGKLSIFAALEQSDRQIEAWRAILTFIIAVRRKILNRRCQSRVTKNVSHGAIDRRVAAAGFLISWTTPVADHRDDESVLYTPAV